MEKIAIVGAECTGKSTLLNALGAFLPERLNRPVIVLPELLREFCNRESRTPTKHEQLPLINSQIELENSFRSADSSLLLSDCAPITIAIYSQIYFQDMSLMEVASNHHQTYGLTLVTSPDIGWQADGIMRDGADIQQQFHQLLLAWITKHQIKTIPISGNGLQREAQAFAAIIKAYARGPA
jgi:nicotinamide riboside kinase